MSEERLMEESMGNQNTRPRQDRGGQAADLSIGGADTLRQEGAALGRIDQYELVRELGGGGFGTVYLARDTVAGIGVAVKGLPPLMRNNAEELERIRENFALVSRLHHPHIAAALHLHPAQSVDYADGRARQALRVFSGDYLMVMAFAPGVTLSRWRKQFPEGKVPVGQALEVCRQIASALDYAHSEKVAHRDVKPGNVMVETRGQRAEVRGQRAEVRGQRAEVRGQRAEVRGQRAEVRGQRAEGIDQDNAPTSGLRPPTSDICVRVLDFGLAAEIRSSMSRVSQEQGDTSGTRPYMAPEQWAGRKQDGRTDQYALAVLYYELVSGAVPFASAFETGDPVVMENAVENKRPEPVEGLTKTQNAALLRALAKEPGERFADCGQLVAALGGERSQKSGVRNQKKAWALWLAAAAAAVAVGAVLSVRSFRAARAEEELQVKSRKVEIQKETEKPKLTDQEPIAEDLCADPVEFTELVREEAIRVTEVPERVEIQAPVVDVERNKESAVDVVQQAVQASKQVVAETGVPEGQFSLRLKVEGGDRVYRGGERVVFAVQANQDCHLGLVCHQQDGSVVVLFPNLYHPDSRVLAGEQMRIPGEVDPAFEIMVGPPYGEDRVEAIACVAKSELHSVLEKAASGNRLGYGVVERGVYLESVGNLGKTASLDGRQQKLSRVEILLRTQE